MNKEYMSTFREARRVMGFTHTSSYVPNNRLAEFSLFVERLKAERMLEICQMAPHSRERLVLANRNITDVPEPSDVKAMLARHPHQPAMNRVASELLEHLTQANTAINVAKMEDDEDVRVKYMSLGVAHNHMANVLWRELVAMASQLEPSSARA